MAKALTSVEELFDLAASNLKQGLERPNIYGYTPYLEQQQFHECTKVGRYLAGGNRGGKCLVEGTLVQMADGSVKPIEDIAVGEQVIAPDGTATRVSAVWDKGLQPVNRYRIGRYQDVVEVVTTENHKFWGARESHGKLGEFERHPIKDLLRKGDVILCFLDGEYLNASVKEFTDEGWQQCYDITVEHDTHCFMLANGLFTSNTDAMVAEMVFWATDTHPWQQRPAEWGSGPLQLRCFVVDVEKGVNQILLPKLRRYIPVSFLIDGDFDKSWNAKSLILTLENGTTIDFLTYGMGLEKMGGVPRHMIFFDEEPPQAIFTESLMRLIDFKGRWVIAATPVQGIGWTFDLLWEPGRSNPDSPASPGTFTLSAAKNPYLKTSAEYFDVYAVGMDEEEREMRFEGKFVARSGLIFPGFHPDVHCVELERYFPGGRIPNTWRIYSSTDHGLNNPTAWLWHAVSPEGDIVTFAEHYKRNMLIEEHAVVVKQLEAELGIVTDLRTGDPAMRQRNAVTGTNILQEYAKHGLYIGVEGVPHEVEIGLDIMHSYFKPRDTGSFWGHGRPKWVISYVCINFIKELKKLRYASYDSQKAAYDKNKQEIVHKKDDHAFDSARYFATLMPNLAPPDPFANEPGYTFGSRSYADIVAESAAREQAWSLQEVGDDDW